MTNLKTLAAQLEKRRSAITIERDRLFEIERKASIMGEACQRALDALETAIEMLTEPR